jgi:CHAT domain-containing protein
LVSGCCNAQTASDLLSQADRFADAGNWVSARPLYVKAEAEFLSAGDGRNELYAKFGRLHRDVEAGSYRNVRDELVRDLANPTVENDPKLKIRALALKGAIDLNLNTTAAGEDWSQILTIAKQTGDRKWENRANGELGLVAGLNGDVGTAALALIKAISTADQLGDIAAHLNFATWLGNGMAVNGMADRAMPILDRAIEIARSSSYSGVPLQLYIAKIRALTLLSEPRQKQGIDEAKRLIAEALTEAREKDVRGAQSEILIQAGQLAAQEKGFEKAEPAFKEAADIADAAKLPREKAEALLHLSQLYRATNEPIKAGPAIDRAIEALQRVEEPYDLPLFMAEKAESQAALGNLHEADRIYDQATDLIEGLLVNAPSSQVKSSMIGAMSDIYLGHFRLAWEKLHDGPKAFQVIESARGRALLDSIRYARQSGTGSSTPGSDQAIARLQKTLLHTRLDPAQTKRLLAQLDDAYDRLSNVEYSRNRKEMEILRRPPVPLAALRRQLSQSESLIEYVLDKKASYAMQVTRTGLTIRALPARAEIEKLVKAFLSDVKAKRESTASAQALYARVLAPMTLERSSSIVVVPDGSLHLVPLGALVAANGDYAIKNASFSAAPSATVHYTLRTARTRTSAVKPFLGVAYSPGEAGNTAVASTSRSVFDAAGGDLRPLPFAHEEVGEAASILGPESVTLNGDAASEAALKAQPLQEFKIIHMAVHGVTNTAEPDRAALVLAAGSESEDGLWQAREIRRSRLNADLVVLSACDTGTGRLHGQEGVMNLAREFLTAGARSVVASLWSVDDRSTATLMGFFYDHLAAGIPVGESLRRAQLDLIKEYGAKAQPYFWAGFEVIGDGTKRITFEAKSDSRSARSDIR